jgi:Protein of unknown function, DUF547
MNSNLLLFIFWSCTLPAHPAALPDDSLFTRVLADHVVDGKVNYAAMKNDRRFATYIDQVEHADPGSCPSRNDSLAFWINAYNAFTIKLIVDHYPVASIRDVNVPGTSAWDIQWIRIGDAVVSLNQIEHSIIRKQFDEPLIHMALVCAAVSCPPLRSEAYVGATLPDQLRDNAARFLADTSKNRYDAATNTLYLSEIFNWFGDDFAARYGSAEQFALQGLGIADVKPAKVVYLTYDWSLNSQ